MLDFAAARRHMIEGQIRTNDVTDRTVLDALSRVPREKFVPASKRAIAYADEDMLIHTSEDGTERYIMEPRVFARLLQLADIRKGDLVLHVGAGLGYGPAVISHLAETVVALESDPALAAAAADNLTEAGADNVAVVEGPLPAGCPDQGPFDVIVVEGALPRVPDALAAQLKEGGRLVCVVGTGLGGRARLVEKIGGVIGDRDEFSAAVAPLAEFEEPPSFVF